jgi:hypothetical protein
MPKSRIGANSLVQSQDRFLRVGAGAGLGVGRRKWGWGKEKRQAPGLCSDSGVCSGSAFGWPGKRQSGSRSDPGAGGPVPMPRAHRRTIGVRARKTQEELGGWGRSEPILPPPPSLVRGGLRGVSDKMKPHLTTDYRMTAMVRQASNHGLTCFPACPRQRTLLFSQTRRAVSLKSAQPRLGCQARARLHLLPETGPQG